MSDPGRLCIGLFISQDCMLIASESPGRFFVAHEFRLIAAYLLLNFDFKLLDERPRSSWIGSGMVPPFGVKIELRRKKLV